MEDSNNILLNGTGTPYVAIFDSKKNPIMDPVSNLPIGELVSSFTYVYDEEREDNGNIHIICNNPNLVALPALGYQMGLNLQWGWILSESSIFCGPVRKVIIVGVKVEFTSNGIEIDLDIADSSILLKNTPSNYYKNNTKGYLFSEYLRCLFSGVPIDTRVSLNDYSSSQVIEVKKFFAVVDRNKISDYEALSKENTVGNRYVLDNGKMDANGIPTYHFLPKNTSANYNDLLPIVIVDYDPNSKEPYEKWAEKMDELVKKFPSEYGYINIQQPYNFANVIKGTSKNIWSQFLNLANNVPNGPYYMDGRDGKLEIHNRKYNRPVSKIYTYYGGNGELLYFSVESKFIKKTVSVSKGSEISPEDKSIKSKSEQLVNVEEKVLYINPYYTNETYGNMPTWPGGAANLYFNDSKKFSYNEKLLPDKNRTFSQKVNNPNSNPEEERFIKFYENFPKYDSVSDGIDSSRYNDLSFTKEELKSYKTLLETNFNELLENKDGINPNSSEKSISDNLHGLVDKLPPFQVKRQFLVKSYKNRPLIDYTDRANYPVQEYHGGFNFGGKDENDEPYGLKLLQMNIPQVSTGSYVYYDLYEITFQVDGFKLINQGALDSGVAMGNDLENSTTNQITASATVLGDPTIESSMNFIIQNVSDLYSGKWYAKKITHNIDQSSGYTCDIEFIQQNRVTEKITITSEVSTNSMVKPLLNNIKEYQKNFVEGNLFNPSLVDVAEVKLKEERKRYPNHILEAEVKDGEVTINRIKDDGTPENNYPTFKGEEDYKRFDNTLSVTPLSRVF